jgi:hypothetical protein
MMLLPIIEIGGYSLSGFGWGIPETFVSVFIRDIIPSGDTFEKLDWIPLSIIPLLKRDRLLKACSGLSLFNKASPSNLELMDWECS